MTKKKVRLLILCIAILLIAGIAVSYFLPTNIPLSSLQSKDVFQFRNFRCGTAKGCVKLLWSGILEPYSLPPQDVLLSEASAKVNGNPADVYFYFQDGELYQVAITVKDCNDAWTQALVEEARQLYGAEDTNAENKVYKWYRDDTIFCIAITGRKQVMLIITNTSEPV